MRSEREVLKRIKNQFVGIPVQIDSEGYPYSLFSLTDCVPPIEPALIEDMANLIVRKINSSDFDIVVSEADRGGGPLAHAVALKLGVPYSLANWYPLRGVKGELMVKTSIGFSGKGRIYLNGVKGKKNALIVDDLLSTGGTVLALLEALKKAGVNVGNIAFVAEKVNKNGRERILNSFDVPITSLVKFKTENGVTEEVV